MNHLFLPYLWAHLCILPDWICLAWFGLPTDQRLLWASQVSGWTRWWEARMVSSKGLVWLCLIWFDLVWFGLQVVTDPRLLWASRPPTDPRWWEARVVRTGGLVWFGWALSPTWDSLGTISSARWPETPKGVSGHREDEMVGGLSGTHRRYAGTGSLPESAAGGDAGRSCHPPPPPPYAPLRKDRE